MRTKLYLATCLFILLVLLASCVPPIDTTPQSNNPSPSPAKTAVILIVDDFSQEEYNELKAQELLVKYPDYVNLNCLATPEGQGGVYIKVKASLDALPQPHGALVYSSAADELLQHNFKLVKTDGNRQLWQSSEGAQIVLVAIDTPDWGTQAMESNLSAALNNILANGIQVGDSTLKNIQDQDIVINLSYALVPCDPLFGFTSKNPEEPQTLLNEFRELLAQYRARDSIQSDNFFGAKVDILEKTLDSLQEELNSGNSESVWLKLLYLPDLGPLRIYKYYTSNYGELAGNGTENGTKGADKLYETILSGKWTVIASAGNQGLSTPYAPASLPGVVSSSAYTEEVNPIHATWSNAGEVMTMGIAVDAGAQVTTSNGNLAAGTSFSAPRLSALMAIYLVTGGSDSCSGTKGNSHPPLDHSTWDNLDVKTAATEFCSGFSN
ncbi:MAG: S8/S53 family peptidase [Caldilineaceae bacterium]